ncbi:patatin-like phospholipase family protein [Parvularcula marina]|uniref:Patatin-like phospholipase family protein n=1 Tax=Parvularcula marina TaxID=2292771 RepID=A0A371R8M5_9PROT|nr:patatin-like phospholipase family protein [Parvularcula marina]RFB01748.1 patatin-like phospholipase family protein [Parvularcula marina]
MTRALVLTGGGARGAYQVGVLKALAKLTPEGTQPFPVITGVSVGALNASVLATEPENFAAGARKLEEIWRSLHCDQIFTTRGRDVRGRLRKWASSLFFGWAGAHPPPSLLDNSPLGELLLQHVDFEEVNRAVGNSPLRALAITASSYATGRAYTYFVASADIGPWERARRSGHRAQLAPEHILASSALPLVFPAVDLEGVYFGDGALRGSAPLSAAIHLGASQIVTIGARDIVPDPEPSEAMDYPTVGYLAGQMLDILFNDNMDADIERARRINHTLGLMYPETRDESPLRQVQITSIDPSQDVRPIAGKHIGELPGSIRMVMGAIGALKEPWVLPSYLLFEPGYIGALIDLGESDALAKWQAESSLFAS